MADFAKVLIGQLVALTTALDAIVMGDQIVWFVLHCGIIHNNCRGQ